MTISSSHKQQRRRVLKIMMGTGLLSVFGSFLASTNTIERQLVELASSLSKHHSVRNIGHAYISKHPQESNPDRLVQLLEESTLVFRTSYTTSIEHALDFAICRDFDQDQTETIYDWWLSRTEARLYALSTLMV